MNHKTQGSLTNKVIKQLVEKGKEISLLDKISSTLNWDLNVNLPPKAAAERAEQNAFLTGLVTQRWHDPAFTKLLKQAGEQTDLSREEQAIVRNLNHFGKYFLQVPEELIVEKSK